MRWVLRTFHQLVFSTEFQRDLYRRSYRKLPFTALIENAVPASGEPVLHEPHDPLRLLFLGRFVRFKNISCLLRAVGLLPHVRLTIAGEGPLEEKLKLMTAQMGLGGRITFSPPVHGETKKQLFADHDALILPSLTEISPNAALEARSMGLPVLLTEETGLSTRLTNGMVIRKMRTSADITRAVLEVEQNYGEFAHAAALPYPAERLWTTVVEEHLALFRQLLFTEKRPMHGA